MKLPHLSLFLQMLIRLEIANVLILRILSCICIEGILRNLLRLLFFSSTSRIMKCWCSWHIVLSFMLFDMFAETGVEKVKVELYSESLCPYCAEFIVNYLNPFFNNGIIDIVELRIIPYGNAHVDSSGRMVCQVSLMFLLWHPVDRWASPLAVG